VSTGGQGAAKVKRRIISLEAGIALVVALTNVVLEQAEVHIMAIVRIGVLLSILLCVDILTRTKWVSHPEYGKLRLTLGLGVILAAFLSFGAFLSTHKRSVAESTAGQTAGRQTIAPHETRVIAQNSARLMHRPPHRNKLTRKSQSSPQAGAPPRLEPAISGNETPSHPCQPNFVIHTGASDMIIVNNTIITTCTAFVETFGHRTLLANNRIIQYPQTAEK